MCYLPMLPATLHQEKNKGPSLYKHSELSPFTCYFPSKSGENSFHKKILGLCFVVFQIPQGREQEKEGASRSQMQKLQAQGASCCSSPPYVCLTTTWIYDIPCSSLLGWISMLEKSIKKQAFYRAMLRLVSWRETAGPRGWAVLLC